VEPSSHLEQIVGRLLRVGKDESADTLSVGNAMEISCLNVGRTSRLPRLENQRPDLPRRAKLLFEPFVNVTLNPVQLERNQTASFGPDLQALLGVVRKIVFETLPYRPLRL
jgi:hypothetical protein